MFFRGNMSMDPAAAWTAPDVIQKLMADPGTREHMADPGFRATIEQLRCAPQLLPSKMSDPRVMQAQMVLALDAASWELTARTGGQ
jgi:hypothetical protein